MRILILILTLFSGSTFAQLITIDTILESDPPSKFIVADKVAGKIIFYDRDNNVAVSSSALFGKMKSDIYDAEYYDSKLAPPGYITPAGVFPLKKYLSRALSTPLESMLVYVPGEYLVLAMHRVYKKNPAQRRVARLLSETPDDNRITNGCINIPDKFYEDYLENLPNDTLLYVLPETHAGREKFLTDLKKYKGVQK